MRHFGPVLRFAKPPRTVAYPTLTVRSLWQHDQTEHCACAHSRSQMPPLPQAARQPPLRHPPRQQAVTPGAATTAKREPRLVPEPLKAGLGKQNAVKVEGRLPLVAVVATWPHGFHSDIALGMSREYGKKHGHQAAIRNRPGNDGGGSRRRERGQG